MVIGGGTGGLRLAVRAAAAGFKTVLFEPGKLGGTCLNNGCIPTKAMLEAAHRYEALDELSEFGISVQKPSYDFKKLMNRVLGIIRTGQKHIKAGVTRNKKLTHITKPAQFIASKVVVADGKHYTAEKIIIATGATNFIPPIQGINKVNYLTNESVLKLKELPKSILLVGCGYISMEYATFFRALGSKVTMFERCEQVLQMLDDDVAEFIIDEYESKGIQIHTSIEIESIIKSDATGKYRVKYHSLSEKKPKTQSKSFDAIFMATGRFPNTKNLALEKAGIKTGPRGNVIVNHFMETNVPDVYAMGDVTGQTLFAHAAKREANAILYNLKEPKIRQRMNFNLVPWVAFTDPNISGVGLSEQQLKDQRIDYETAHVLMKKAGRTTIINDTRGFAKVHYSPISKKILGAMIVGPRADELIHEIVAVMNSKDPTIDVIRRTIHAHPTVSEIWGDLHS